MVPRRHARGPRADPRPPRRVADRALDAGPAMRPHIYTIAADRPFLATLAKGLVALAEGDPLRLPRMTVLLPTRRAARSLREAFLRLTGEGSDPGAPLLLPRMRPVGDLDGDEFADDETLAIAPAIPDLRRRLLLTRLVLKW